MTAADLQLCLLIRLRFTNAQVATLIAVSPASVSQQKFRLKKRLMQEEETLFKDGETVDGVEDGQMRRDVQWKCQYEEAD